MKRKLQLLLILILVTWFMGNAQDTLRYCLEREQTELTNTFHLRVWCNEPLMEATQLLYWDGGGVGDTFFYHENIEVIPGKTSFMYYLDKGVGNLSYYNLSTFQIPPGDTIYSTHVVGQAMPIYLTTTFTTRTSWPLNVVQKEWCPDPEEEAIEMLNWENESWIAKEKEEAADKQVYVYPNPSSGMVIIELKYLMQVEIVDMQGKQVHRFYGKYDAHVYPPGFYVCRAGEMAIPFVVVKIK